MDTNDGRMPSGDWRQTVGEYIVSRFGYIRHSRDDAPVLSGTVDHDGYARVRLTICGRKRAYRIHRLVCEAFHGTSPPGRQCGHLDGNRLNNRADNLAWVTAAENASHKRLHGTELRNERNGRCTISDDQVTAIRADRMTGIPYAALAALHGISASHACRICRGVVR